MVKKMLKDIITEPTFSMCEYLAAGALGLAAGLCFSRAQYYQGRMDAAVEMHDAMLNVVEEFNSQHEKAEQKSEKEEE